jgi:hypothetical protein
MIIEAVNSQKRISTLQVDGERLKLLLLILYAYAIGCSFFRKVDYGGNFSPKVFNYNSFTLLLSHLSLK